MDLAGMESERSMSLSQFFENEGLLPSPEKEIKRNKAIEKLKQIVMEWVQRVAYQRQFPERAASAAILIHGSFALGVHSNESNIDALCVGPCFATMEEDFFVVLRDVLGPEVSAILRIKDARVPLLRFIFDGIKIDLAYAKIETTFVPENVLDPFFSASIDEISQRSLSGVRVNKDIVRLVPDLEAYRSLLRGVKLWAKRRGIYESELGFFGGLHLAVLAAFVCRRHPNTFLSALVSEFFQTFAFWHWTTPVTLEDRVITPLHPDNDRVGRYTMPIHLPCSSNEYCYCGTTRSTYTKIVKEFRLGHDLTKDFRKPDFAWKVLFEPFSYAKTYKKFLKICLSSACENELGELVGWMKSRFPRLIFMLEKFLEFCDPNPTEYTDNHLSEPHVIFYWGLCFGVSKTIFSVNSIKEDLMKNVFAGCDGPVGRMELTVVKASEFPQTRINP